MLRVLFFLCISTYGSVSYGITVYVNAEYAQLNSGVGGDFRITDPCVTLPISFVCENRLSRIVAIDANIDRALSSNVYVWHRLFHHHFTGEKNVVMSDGKGNSRDMKFSFTHTGFIMTKRALSADNNIAQADPVANCKLVDAHLSSTDTLLYEINPAEQKTGGRCYSRAFTSGGGQSVANVNKILFGYKLIPIGIETLPNGLYQGRLRLLVGSNKDFDYGDLPNPSPQSIDLEFRLVVRNQIKVIFPVGGNRLVLQPDGIGWHSSRVPTLSGLLPMQVISSVPVAMTLKCEFIGLKNCLLKNNSNKKSMALDVYRINKGQDTLLSPITSTRFNMSGSTVRDSLLFKINSKNVEGVLDSPGAYKGNVTIVIDAVIDPVTQ
ncbi:hypothetical protein ACK33G_14595 [Aeromonas jandaei]|uniref:hypothetical protein n=1 Tax=Aeromonas jandaei TaxID=650 RepID=UPI003986D24A